VSGDAKFADEAIEDVIKTMTKMGLLWKEGQVLPADLDPLKEPGRRLAEETGMLLRRVATSVEPLREPDASAAASSSVSASVSSELDVRKLHALCQEWKELVFPILLGKMKEKNLERARKLAEYYTAREFLSVFMNRDDLAEERQRLVPLVDDALRRAGGTAFGDRPRCGMTGCDLHKASIPGTEYCQAHHAIRFSSPVSLMDFLDNPNYASTLKAYMEEFRPHLLPVLEFYFRTSRLATSKNRAVVKQHAKPILRRYVVVDAPERLFFLPGEHGGGLFDRAWGDVLPEGMPGADEPAPSPCPAAIPDRHFEAVGGIASALDEERLGKATEVACSTVEDPTVSVRPDVFAGINGTALAILDADFVCSFSRSPHFRRWASDNLGIPLPRISLKRIAMLQAQGVTVEAVTGGHVLSAGEDNLVAMTPIGASALGVDVGVPVSLRSGEVLTGDAAVAALSMCRQDSGPGWRPPTDEEDDLGTITTSKTLVADLHRLESEGGVGQEDMWSPSAEAMRD
jgi:hypothetical protein